ncbi:MAG: desulfoferrodoxin [Candidatus Thermoplasmatota archaeon]
MTEIREIYKCEICGNIVEVLHTGKGELVCCGEPMKLMEPQTDDSSTEKHVPYVEETEDGVVVKIGENESHPMTEEHHIEWIQVIADGKSYRKFLKPGDSPKAEFKLPAEDVTTAREYCNIHGLWKN